MFDFGNVGEGFVMSDNRQDVITFAQAATLGDQLDEAGQTILQMLSQAAGVAEESNRHALETAQRLSHQLRGAEERIAELEKEVTAYQQKAERAEQWLHRVHTEIENRFLRQGEVRRGAPQRSQRNLH
jgi:hypothetical protein